MSAFLDENGKLVTVSKKIRCLRLHYLLAMLLKYYQLRLKSRAVC